MPCAAEVDGHQRPAFVVPLENILESYSPTTQTTKIAAPKAKNDSTVIADLALEEDCGAVCSEDS
jgi:hypothetical protein